MNDKFKERVGNGDSNTLHGVSPHKYCVEDK